MLTCDVLLIFINKSVAILNIKFEVFSYFDSKKSDYCVNYDAQCRNSVVCTES